MTRDELLRDHMREGTRFVERSLEVKRTGAWPFAAMVTAQCSIVAIAPIVAIGKPTLPPLLLASLLVTAPMVTLMAVAALVKAYDRAMRPRPEPVDSIEED